MRGTNWKLDYVAEVPLGWVIDLLEYDGPTTFRRHQFFVFDPTHEKKGIRQ